MTAPVTFAGPTTPSLYSADDFAQVIAGELPTGAAWPRDTDSDLMAWVEGCAQIWGDVATREAALLFVETDPRYTADMLPDWERNFGLPDPCVQVVLSIPERRVALLNRMTTEGGQSVVFFEALAATLGYSIIITEYKPFQFGVSSFGGSRGQIQSPLVRFYWSVSVTGPRLTRFSFGNSSFGRDSLLEIQRTTDLQCVLTRWKPAHTILLFDYLGI